MRFLLVVLLLSGFVSKAHAESSDVTVIDGDEFVFDAQHYQIFGIKAPKATAPFGEQAKKRLAQILSHGFDLIPARPSSGDRKTVRVIADRNLFSGDTQKIDAAVILLREGLVEDKTVIPLDGRLYFDAEKEAFELGRGRWNKLLSFSGGSLDASVPPLKLDSASGQHRLAAPIRQNRFFQDLSGSSEPAEENSFRHGPGPPRSSHASGKPGTYNTSRLRPNEHWVDGYTRKDGTKVRGHWRTNPDSDRSNNYSSYGNTNPHSGKRGSVRSGTSGSTGRVYVRPYTRKDGTRVKGYYRSR